MLKPIHHRIICIVSLGVIATYLLYRWYTEEEKKKEYENMSFFEAMLKEDEERREIGRPVSRSEDDAVELNEEAKPEGKKVENSNKSGMKSAALPPTISCSKDPVGQRDETNSSK